MDIKYTYEVSDLWVFGWGMVGVMACQQKSPCSSNSILDYKGFLFSADIKNISREMAQLYWALVEMGDDCY